LPLPPAETFLGDPATRKTLTKHIIEEMPLDELPAPAPVPKP